MANVKEKLDVVLHPEINQLSQTIQATILREISELAGRKVKWDEIERQQVKIEVEVSMF